MYISCQNFRAKCKSASWGGFCILNIRSEPKLFRARLQATVELAQLRMAKPKLKEESSIAMNMQMIMMILATACHHLGPTSPRIKAYLERV